MKNIIITILLVILVGAGYYFYTQDSLDRSDVESGQDSMIGAEESIGDGTEAMEQEDERESVIGISTEEREIIAYHYGDGDKELLFVGGIHGGYSWNTSLVAYETMDYLEANPEVIPENVKVTVIPILNPDGLNKVVDTNGRFEKSDVSSSQSLRTSGRFNANDVDLNRNFDCDWQPTGIWQTKTVSGGDQEFSEPESQALKGYIEENAPNAVVVWYSAAGGVFSSSCHDGVLPETRTITNIFADASGYPAYEDFDFYKITGDAVNWLAKEKIPAISVLLSTHEDVEWDKNRKGIEALLKHYAE
jgi:hypothetical protein